MGVKSNVSRWGSSLAVRIPKAIAEQWGVEEGSRVEIVVREDLDALIEQMSPDRRHREIDWGRPEGAELC